MVERYWNKDDITKEERQLVNTIMRIAYYNRGAYANGDISEVEYKFTKAKCIYALSLCEDYFSDEETLKRDFENWKDGFEQYQSVRDKL